MTAQEFQAGAIERAAAMLAHFLDTTPSERHDWTPTIDGAAGLRSALDQVSECIHANRMFSNILRGGQPLATPPMLIKERPFSDVEDAKAKLTESARELAGIVRGLSDDDLEREFPSRRGMLPGYLLLDMPLRNMNYHCGQINQLQLCYGDTEFHTPSPSASPKI